MVTTTLQAYGFDSYPFRHLANRLCLPYETVLLVVEALREGAAVEPTLLGALREGDFEAIVGVYVGEWRRQEIAAAGGGEGRGSSTDSSAA